MQTARDSATRLSEADAKVQVSLSTLHDKYSDVSMRTGEAAGQLVVLEKSVYAVEAQAQKQGELLRNLTVAQDRVTILEASQAATNDAMQALSQSGAGEVRALREVVEAQAQRLQSLETAFRLQQEEVVYLQGENRRLLRETASAASVDELRKLLFDVQGQMLSHSGKVLDILLQPRSAVLVHAPSPLENVAAT